MYVDRWEEIKSRLQCAWSRSTELPRASYSGYNLTRERNTDHRQRYQLGEFFVNTSGQARPTGTTQDHPAGRSKGISVASSNIEGIKPNSVYFQTLCSQYDIICVQEHWCWNFQVHELGDLSINKDYHVRCSDQNEPISGFKLPRGKGGVAIFWPNLWSSRIKKLSDGNERTIAIEIQGQVKICLINVYMPTNNSSVNSHLEYTECLDIYTIWFQNLDKPIRWLCAETSMVPYLMLGPITNMITVRTEIQWTTLFCVYFALRRLIAQWPSEFNTSINRLIGDIFFVTKCIVKWAVIWWNLSSFEHLHFLIYPKCTFVRITAFSLLSMNNYTVL